MKTKTKPKTKSKTKTKTQKPKTPKAKHEIKPKVRTLSPESKKSILDLLSIGTPVRTSCRASGADEDAFYSIMKRARILADRMLRNDTVKPSTAEEKESLAFRQEVLRAVGKAEVRFVANLARAKDWRASSWMLERRFHGNWARKDLKEIVQKSEYTLDRDRIKKVIADDPGLLARLFPWAEERPWSVDEDSDEEKC